VQHRGEVTAALAGQREWVERLHVSRLELESPDVGRLDRAKAQFEPGVPVPLRVEVDLPGAVELDRVGSEANSFRKPPPDDVRMVQMSRRGSTGCGLVRRPEL